MQQSLITTLHFPDEVRSTVDPTKYHDEYRERLEKLIENKIPKKAEQPSNVINLYRRYGEKYCVHKGTKETGMKYVKPMLLGTRNSVNWDVGWLNEPKYDGFRLLVGNGHSYTRHGTITTSRLPELIFGGDEALLDGELNAPGEQSPDDFSSAMSRFSGNKEQPISLMSFDVISYQNETVEHWPTEER